MDLTLSQLASYLGGTFEGQPDYKVTGIAPLDAPKPNELSFIVHASKLANISDFSEVGVLLMPDVVEHTELARVIRVSNVYLAYAKLSALFDKQYRSLPDIHSSAVVDSSAQLGERVCLGANVVVGKDVKIADDVVIGAGSVIGDGCILGQGSYLHSHVTFYSDVKVGVDCIFHSGSVIGADGFGFAPTSTGWQKIHQLAGVTLGDEVEVGANTTIDRGALTDTVIGSGVKLDNLIQIAHNVEIGEHTAIAACTAIAGSTKIGRQCTIAGHSGVVGHINIADGTHIAAMTLVTKSIAESGAYASGTGMQLVSKWKKSVAHFRQLDKLARRVKQLEKKLSDMSKG